MNYFTGMESLNFKMVSILFIVLLNITSLSSQNKVSEFKSKALIYPTSTYYKQKAKCSALHMEKKIYTFYLAKTFPLLEASTKQNLAVKDDSETFDYSTMFCSASTLKADLNQESIALAISTKK